MNIIKELEKRLDAQKDNNPEITARALKARELAKVRNIKPTPRNIYKLMQELKDA